MKEEEFLKFVEGLPVLVRDRKRQPPTRPVPTAKLETWGVEIPKPTMEEVWRASPFGQYEWTMERVAETEVERSSDPLKARYVEIRRKLGDPKLPIEEKRVLAREAQDLLDQIMKDSEYYQDYLRSKARGTWTLETREPRYTFKTGMPAEEARKTMKWFSTGDRMVTG